MEFHSATTCIKLILMRKLKKNDGNLETIDKREKNQSHSFQVFGRMTECGGMNAIWAALYMI